MPSLVRGGAGGAFIGTTGGATGVSIALFCFEFDLLLDLAVEGTFELLELPVVCGIAAPHCKKQARNNAEILKVVAWL
jgi:hypothetical protein